MNKLIYPLFALLLIVQSCKNKPEDQEEVNLDKNKLDLDIKIVEDNGIILDLESPSLNTASVDDTLLLVVARTYSEGDLPPITADNWLGIYRQSEQNITVEFASLHIENVEDAFGEEGNLSAINVADIENKQAICYLKGISGINELSFTDYSYHLKDQQLLPGESITIGGITLVAEAGETTEYYPGFNDYHLYLKQWNDNNEMIQEILHIEYFDDAMITFYFIGDLDQDGKIDLLINESYKYSFGNPVLYLSSKARKGELVRRIGQIFLSSC
ncbi:MAG: hypothetical protein H6600_08855 [Flavobacteriales bacterium]|nr:hypothetical protein [Flavobacteriales bacterium]MCB9196361.1 hypothetical protein [Flavobacteriales bacterium]MCB9198556.1 hypothetical protein [Flavobacteriales bacterium]